MDLFNMDLFRHTLGDDEVVALAERLKNDSTATVVDLRHNSFGSRGAVALAEALATSTSVEKVDLSEAPIGDEGASALARALLVNTSIQDLVLGRCQIGDKGAKALAASLRANTTLRSIALWKNSFGDDAAGAFLEAARANSSVQSIALYVAVTQASRTIDEAIRSNAEALAQWMGPACDIDTLTQLAHAETTENSNNFKRHAVIARTLVLSTEQTSDPTKTNELARFLRDNWHGHPALQRLK
jgi:hypothetical protein